MINALKDNTAKSRYEFTIDGQIVFADYRKEGKVVYLLHVEAPPALRGTGAAGRFMEVLMQSLRTEGYKVVPVCSYAVYWLERNEQYNDMIAA